MKAVFEKPTNNTSSIYLNDSMCQVLLLFHKCCWIFRCQGMVLNNEIDRSIQFGIVYIYINIIYYMLYILPKYLISIGKQGLKCGSINVSNCINQDLGKMNKILFEIRSVVSPQQ